MQTVVQTPQFLRDAADAGLSDDEIATITATIASNPLAGDLMPGTGGARKLRFAGRGKGKSGGYRAVTYFGGDDIPVFLIGMFGKGDKDNLSRAERNELHKILSRIAADYRASVKRKVAALKARARR